MALDGFTVANIVWELNETIVNGRIDKISQPEADEIILSVRSKGQNFKLLLSANASHPRLHLTNRVKDNPFTPPLFCMVLRKRLNGRICSISQPGFERIVNITIESPDEMGYVSEKYLIIEIMGKHSNIILTDKDGVIIDSIKRVSHEKSSVREVLPGKLYFPPPSKKIDPLEFERQRFTELMDSNGGAKIQDLIYQSFTGVSPVMAGELCFRARLDPSKYCQELDGERKSALCEEIGSVVEAARKNAFAPEIYFDDKNIAFEFCAFPMKQFSGLKNQKYPSISDLLDDYYSRKDLVSRSGQKKQDLRRAVMNLIARCLKKDEIIQKTLAESETRELYRVYGETIRANMYRLEKGMAEFTAPAYFPDKLEDVAVSLDVNKTPSENMQHYFKLYNKHKRAVASASIQADHNDDDRRYFESVLTSLDNCVSEAEIDEIRSELVSLGYLKRKAQKATAKRSPSKTKPFEYKSSDGFEILAGKNNSQNDDLTFKTARSNDMWLHAKGIPASHVIIKTNGEEIPAAALNEACKIAAFHSKTGGAVATPIDYCLRKYVKKPSGAKPGMVIYENYKTVYAVCEKNEIANFRMDQEKHN